MEVHMSLFSFLHIEDQIIQQALNNPGHIAIEDSERSITYQQLHDLSDCVANNILDYGVSPEQLIPVCAKKSIEVIIIIIGILKAGCAFVPMSTEWPIEMLEQVVLEIDCDFIVIDALLDHPVTQLKGNIKPVLIQSLIHNDNAHCAQPRKSRSDLAYVIYTSGSTGKPKGVMVNHENLLATQQSWNALYQLETGSSRHLQMADISFDVFIGDWVRALTTGNVLVLCPKKYLLLPEDLFSYIQKKNIHFAEFVPVVLRRLVSYLKQTQQMLEVMKILICGSDCWSIGELKETKSVVNKQCRIFNTYGISECTIDSTYFEVNEDEIFGLENTELVPIGKSLPHASVKILDEDFQEVKSSAQGEICIFGSGVSQGYFKRDNLAKERFIKDSSGKNLFYRTGDIGCQMSDGNIIFRGRNDYQIKIYGKRFNLNILENILKDCTMIQDAIVKAKKIEDTGTFVLQGYLVLKNNSISYDFLINSLRNKVPDYAIPRVFYEISAIPLLTNSKIDRAAIENAVIREIKPSINLPKSNLENRISAVWRDILQLKVVGIDNTLSELGCSSLEYALLLSKMKETFGINVSLEDIADSVTIKSIAEKIQHEKYSLVETI